MIQALRESIRKNPHIRVRTFNKTYSPVAKR